LQQSVQVWRLLVRAWALAESAVRLVRVWLDMAGQIQTAMIIAAALIEGAAFFALVVCLLV
jgi:F-type H+-transporting ATPase subunit c